MKRNVNLVIALIALIVLMLSAGAAFSTSEPTVDPIDFAPVLFETGKAKIADPIIEMVGFDPTRDLEDAGDILRRFPNFEISITGHTDTRECSGDACLDLSRRRAQFVADWLIARGLERTRIKDVHGMGSRDPVGHNEVANERALNRRVEILAVRP